MTDVAMTARAEAEAPEAARLRREIAEFMSDAEIGRAQRAARAWLAAHPQPRTERSHRVAA